MLTCLSEVEQLTIYCALINYEFFSRYSWKRFCDISTHQESLQDWLWHCDKSLYRADEIGGTLSNVWGCCKDTSQRDGWVRWADGHSRKEEFRCFHLHANSWENTKANERQHWHWNWYANGKWKILCLCKVAKGWKLIKINLIKSFNFVFSPFNYKVAVYIVAVGIM